MHSACLFGSNPEGWGVVHLPGRAFGAVAARSSAPAAAAAGRCLKVGAAVVVRVESSFVAADAGAGAEEYEEYEEYEEVEEAAEGGDVEAATTLVEQQTPPPPPHPFAGVQFLASAWPSSSEADAGAAAAAWTGGTALLHPCVVLPECLATFAAGLDAGGAALLAAASAATSVFAPGASSAARASSSRTPLAEVSAYAGGGAVAAAVPLASVTLQAPSAACTRLVEETLGRHHVALLLSAQLDGCHVVRGCGVYLPTLDPCGAFEVCAVAAARGAGAGDAATRAAGALFRVTDATVVRVNLVKDGGGRKKTTFPVAAAVEPAAAAAARARVLPGYEEVWDEVLAASRMRTARHGVLLHGVAGTGKTAFAEALPALLREAAGGAAGAGSLARVDFRTASEDSLRAMVADVAADAAAWTRRVLLADGVDARPAAVHSAASGAAQALRGLLEALPPGCVVVGTALSLSGVPECLRGVRGLGREVYMPPPSERVRACIYKRVCAEEGGSAAEGQARLCAALTAGCVGADVVHVARGVCARVAAGEAGEVAVRGAVGAHRSVLQRAVCTELGTEVTFADVGGLEEVKEELHRYVVWPEEAGNREAARRFGVQAVSGLLLYGPPGCAKTTLVRALAGASGRALISLDAAALFACHVGESEEILRGVFAKARLVAPSMLFIDEVESVCGRRRAEGSASSGDVASKVLITLLNELDGVDTSAASAASSHTRDVVFVGATNHPETLDTAILRPGRLDQLIFVPPPPAVDRLRILELCTRRLQVPDKAAVLQGLASDRFTAGFTGADLKALVTEASYGALRRVVAGGGGGGGGGGAEVTGQDLHAAWSGMKPTVTEDGLRRYSEFARSVSK